MGGGTIGGGSEANPSELIELIESVPDDTDSFSPTLSLIIRQSQSRHVRSGGAGIDTGQLASLILKVTSGPWEDEEYYRGTMTLHRPSMSIAVYQSALVHRELEELFSKLQRLPLAAESVRRQRIPHIGPESPAGWDMSPLIELIMDTTSGWWGGGDEYGTISEFLPAMALTIK
jgi:hypothetical protein